MNLARASKQIVYGQRWRVLFAAVFFPLPLLWSLIGNIRLQGWTLGSALSLTACAGLYVSLITFLASPIRCWWAFELPLAHHCSVLRCIDRSRGTAVRLA